LNWHDAAHSAEIDGTFNVFIEVVDTLDVLPDGSRSFRVRRHAPIRTLDRLAPADVVAVIRIDRLARSTFDLFGIVKRIVDAKAQFRSLAEPWADTDTSTGRLMLAVLDGLADVERDLIRTRTAEGRSRAKARGKHMGGHLP